MIPVSGIGCLFGILLKYLRDFASTATLASQPIPAIIDRGVWQKQFKWSKESVAPIANAFLKNACLIICPHCLVNRNWFQALFWVRE